MLSNVEEYFFAKLFAGSYKNYDIGAQQESHEKIAMSMLCTFKGGCLCISPIQFWNAYVQY